MDDKPSAPPLHELLEKTCGSSLAVLRVSSSTTDASAKAFAAIIRQGQEQAGNLIKKILSLTALQSESIAAIVDVIRIVCDGAEEESDELKFKNSLFQACFKTAPSFRQKVPHFYLLRRLMKAKVFTIAEIGNRIAKFPVSQANQLFSLFLFFAHELFKHRKTTYTNTMEKFAQIRSLDPSLQSLSTAYDDLTKDDFARLHHIIDYGSDILSIENALRTNNVEQLKLFASKPEFNMQKPMAKIPFEIHECLQEKPYYIEYAAFYNSLDCIDYLISLGSEMKQASRYAVAGGKMEAIQYCINKAFPINKMINAALQSMRFDLIDYLISQIGDKASDYLVNAFFKCARTGNLLGMGSCLNHGVSLNAKDVAECTAVIYAATSGVLSSLKFLVEAGANPCADDITGWTPLHFAAKYGFLDVVEYLISLPQVNVNTKTGVGRTALHIACESGHINIIMFLLSIEGIDKDALDTKGNSSLSLITSIEVRKAIENQI